MFGTKKEKSPYGALTLIWEKSPNGAPNCTKRTFLQNRNESHLLKTTPSGLFSRPEMKHLMDFSLFFSNLHHEDFSPNQKGKFDGRNVLLLLFFKSFFEPHTPWVTALQRLNFPLISKKERKGESLALLQI